MSRLRCATGWVFPAVILIAYAPVSLAGIASTTGGMLEIFPPVTFLTGATESSTKIFILDEGIKATTADVEVNCYVPGVHGDTPGPYLIIPAGTVVNSYLVHFDPLGAGFATVSGSVFFDPGEMIIGVQTHTPLLYTTDAMLGHPLAGYPGVFDAFRGFETLPGIDSMTLPPTMDSASFTLFAELGVDHARIITLPVPEPSTFAALAALATLSAIRRRRG